MRSSHGEDLAKKIKLRLDKYQITPYEDEGETLTLFGILRTLLLFSCHSSDHAKMATASSFPQCFIQLCTNPFQCWGWQLNGMN